MRHHTVIAEMIALLISILFAAGCKQTTQPEPEPLRPVRYLKISAASTELERSFVGTAQMGVESRLSFRVTGSIKKLAVRIGDRVKKGQLIAELDPVDFKIKMQEASAALQRARAQARNAQANYDRIRALYENNSASRNDLDSSRATADSTRAAMASARQKLELTRQQLSYTRLTSPSRCAIADSFVQERENVSAGTPIVLLNCGTEPQVKVAMPEVDIGRVHEGDWVEVRFDVLPGERIPAVVTEVGIASTGTATTFPVKAQMLTQDKRIRTGMAAAVVFKFSSANSESVTYLVPAHAVMENTHGRFVFLVDSAGGTEGVIQRRAVQTAKLTEQGIEVVNGLETGDRVVTAGMSKLVDGMRVRLLEREAL